jgi:drug/metabolite transporter (DMT)-like permease
VTETSLLKPRVLIPFILVTLIWGSTWIVIKDQLNVVPPSWSVTYRFLTGGIVMMIVAALTKVPLRLGRHGQAFAALLGVAQSMFNFNFVYRAELYVTSGLVAVVFALLFVPNALFARIFLGHDMSRRFIAGSGIAVTGIALLFINEARGDDAAQTATLTGIAFTLAGVVSASTANVMQASQRAKALPMAAMLGWAMLWGAGFDALFAWFTAGPPVMDWRPSYLLGILFLGVIASALAFSLYFSTIRDIGPARAAYSSTIIPVIAMGFSTVFEGFVWTGLAVAGSVIALAGMVVALSSGKDRAAVSSDI